MNSEQGVCRVWLRSLWVATRTIFSWCCLKAWGSLSYDVCFFGSSIPTMNVVLDEIWVLTMGLCHSAIWWSVSTSHWMTWSSYNKVIPKFHNCERNKSVLILFFFNCVEETCFYLLLIPKLHNWEKNVFQLCGRMFLATSYLKGSELEWAKVLSYMCNLVIAYNICLHCTVAFLQFL